MENKHFLFILLLSLSHGLVFSQNNNFTITGKILESSSKKPLEFVNIFLFLNNDSVVIKSAVSDEVGISKCMMFRSERIA